MLPAGFPVGPWPTSQYHGFPQPPMFNPVKGHNEPLVPTYDKLEFGLYRVEAELDDHLLCTGFDPNGRSEGFVRIKVAKPFALQRTPFENPDDPVTLLLRSVNSDLGVTVEKRIVTYRYSNDAPGIRLAIWEDPIDETTQVEEERIMMPYFRGELIVAVETRIDPERQLGNGATDDTGLPLLWTDLNAAGRHWVNPEPRQAQMTVKELKDDYLICEGRDPATRVPLMDVPVAKPYLLQKTPWDGKRQVVDGKQVQYTYEDNGTREAKATIDDEEVTETQKITPDYFVGDVISVERISALKPLQVTTDSGDPVVLLDQNTGGRTWAVDLAGDE